VSQIDELSWLVGILEGEGSFTYEVANGEYKMARVTLAMVDEDIVRRAAKSMPKARYFLQDSSPSRAGKGYQPLHVARSNGTAALELMEMVLPHMGDRRAARIEEIIEAYHRDRPDFGRCSANHKRKKRGCRNPATSAAGRCRIHPLTTAVQ
jgi:hypothetical protein